MDNIEKDAEKVNSGNKTESQDEVLKLVGNSKTWTLLEYDYKVPDKLSCSTNLLLFLFTSMAIIGSVVYLCALSELKGYDDHILLVFTIGWFAFVSLIVFGIGKSLSAVTRETQLASARSFLLTNAQMLSFAKELTAQDIIRLLELGIDSGKSTKVDVQEINTPMRQLLTYLKEFKGGKDGES